MESNMSQSSPTLAKMEQLAIKLVADAGARLLERRNSPGEVTFKVAPGSSRRGSPVCALDREIENNMRSEVLSAYPCHGIIGEEFDDTFTSQDYIWILDPLDGTSNFLNGLPIYASTIGIICNGVPVVAATWCSTTHTARSGVYHTRLGSRLHFEGDVLQRRAEHSFRGLSTEPGFATNFNAHHDVRVLGSAATECALVAAGVFRRALIGNPFIWDVAAGVLLARSSGCSVLMHSDGEWKSFERFDSARVAAVLREWRAPMKIVSAAESP